MVDHFSDLAYMQLMIRKNEGGKLAGKVSFERWAAAFGVKIKRNHTGNGIFSDQPFRSAIEDSNQTITFCGV